MHDKMGMDPHDAQGYDGSSSYGKGGPGDSKKYVPSPPPCYTVQVSAMWTPLIDIMPACAHMVIFPMCVERAQAPLACQEERVASYSRYEGWHAW